jgi:hypothetical protein
MKKILVSFLALFSLIMAIGCSSPNDPTYTPDPETVADILDSRSGNKITLTTATEGTAIYFTIDGSVPTAEKTLYTNEGIVLTQDTTIKAIAIKAGWYNSSVFSKDFSYTPPENPPPSKVAVITNS